MREHYEKKIFEMKFVKSENNESDICTKNTPEKLLKGHAENIRNGTMRSWREYETTVETVAGVWRENVKNHESNESDKPSESWIEVCHRSRVRSKSILRKSKYDG